MPSLPVQFDNPWYVVLWLAALMLALVGLSSWIEQRANERTSQRLALADAAHGVHDMAEEDGPACWARLLVAAPERLDDEYYDRPTPAQARAILRDDPDQSPACHSYVWTKLV